MSNLLASLIFFTRLPFYKIREVPQECYKHVVSYWSLTGWLTGGIMALTFFITSRFLPGTIAIILALVSRVLVTGALHEDGLADFFDGFGGGTDRDSTLRIMKDSHIGTFGVLGLILYYLLAFHLLCCIQYKAMPFVLIAADAFSKCVCSHILYILPYARKESESKNKTVYSKFNTKEEAISLISGIAALILLVATTSYKYFGCAVLPIATFSILTWIFSRRLQGYTGDCCGAAFLLTELTFWLSAIICL